MHVRLKKKLANVMDGVDVSDLRVGEIVQLPDADAELLITEGWAERVAEELRSVAGSRTPVSD